MSTQNLIRYSLDGVVYWLNNLTGDCYTYSDTPRKIGQAIRDLNDPKTLHIKLRDDWRQIIDEEMITHKQNLIAAAELPKVENA